MSLENKYPLIKNILSVDKGSVFVALNNSGHNLNYKNVLIKTFNKSEEEYFIENDKEYINIPRELHFNNLIIDKSISPLILDSFETETAVIIVMEYLSDNWTSLHRFTRKTRSEDSLKQIFVNVLISLQKLSNQGIYHCDMKPDNVMVNIRTFEVKIIDYEDALYDNENYYPRSKDLIGTDGFIGPELYLGKKYDVKKSLVFTLGCFLYSCLESEYPEENFSLLQYRKSSLAAQKFIHSCIRKNPEERIEYDDILMNPYLKNLYLSTICS